jgi:hypothetical protein
LVHDFDHVLRHRALAIATVVGKSNRFARVAIAAQIWHDQVELLLQALRNSVPHHMGLREAVQQEQGGARATFTARDMGMDVRPFDLKASHLKVIKPVHHYTFNSK